MEINGISFATLSYPIMWSENDNRKETFRRESDEGKNRLIELHDNGYHATLMDTHVITDVVYINYYLEKNSIEQCLK